MALNADNVHVGPVRIFLGVTAGATGNPPTATAHTAGIPSPGTEIGYTTGDAIFRKTKTTGNVMAEQALAPIMTFMTEEQVEVEFEALERVFESLLAALDNTAGSQHSGGKMLFWGGGTQYPLRTQTVFMSSKRPNQTSKWEYSTIYKAYSVTGLETAYRKNNASTYKITLRGLMDTSRTEGDQLYQYVIEE